MEVIIVKTEKEIVDMLVQLTDCGANEEKPCPFFDECDCTYAACREQWEEWLRQ